MLSNILYLDLFEKTSKVVDRKDLFQKYLGGVGVASKLLLEEAKPKIDPFSPDAPIIITIGPLTGLFPCMSKSVALFKSPLTGNLGESHAGGQFANALRFSGYGGIIIKGAGKTPQVIKIQDDQVDILPASSLWGLGTSTTERSLSEPIRDCIQSVATIGPAGENMVAFANVIVDRHHHFGRLGLGSVFGSKKLKAIQIIGTTGVELNDPKAAKEMYEQLNNEVVTTDKMYKYHHLGTSGNILDLNELGALPTRNFKERRFEKAAEMSGENFAEKMFRRKVTCDSCPVACIHLASLRVKFAPEHERGREEIAREEVLVPYNYEPMYSLGSNLGIGNPEAITRLIQRCGDLGLDAMMTGTVLSWVTEAVEKGVLNVNQIGDLNPKWGDPESVFTEMIDNLAAAKHPFYAKLAQGLNRASEKFGGIDFAVILGGNGLAGYTTGYGHIIGTLVGARHSHLSNSGYSIDQKILSGQKTIDDIAMFLVEQENWLNITYSLIACYFSRSIYSADTTIQTLKSIGINLTEEELKEIGKKIFQNLYTYKQQEGFDLEKEIIPKKLKELDTPLGKIDPKVMDSILAQYIKIREREGLKIRKDSSVLKDLLFQDK